ASKLGRHQGLWPHQRGTEAGSKSKKEHAPSTVTAKRLHGRIVDQAYRDAERFGEIETNPPFPQMFRIPFVPSLAHRRRETHGGHVKFPSTRGLFKVPDQLFRSHARP